MKHWSRNDKFAFIGVILAVIGLASALFGQEIRRGLGLDQPQTFSQASMSGADIPRGPGMSAAVPAVAEMTIQVGGDSNTISLNPSPVDNQDLSYTVDADGGQSSFALGPKQTAHIELKGDSNTVHVAAKLKDRVTVVNNGDGNKVVD